MSDLPHLRIQSNEPEQSYGYAGPKPQNVEFARPPRNKPAHGAKVRVELEGARDQATQQRAASRQTHPQLVQWQPEGVTLTFHGEADFELNLDSIERLGSGIQLLSCKVEGGVLLEVRRLRERTRPHSGRRPHRPDRDATVELQDLLQRARGWHRYLDEGWLGAGGVLDVIGGTGLAALPAELVAEVARELEAVAALVANLRTRLKRADNAGGT